MTCDQQVEELIKQYNDIQKLAAELLTENSCLKLDIITLKQTIKDLTNEQIRDRGISKKH